jgi:hypothetical protein
MPVAPLGEGSHIIAPHRMIFLSVSNLPIGASEVWGEIVNDVKYVSCVGAD